MAGYKIQAKKTDGSLVDIPLAATYDDSGKKISEEYATQETVSDIIDGTTKVGKAGEADTATSADHAISADSATSAQSATKATQDSEGNSIIDTYVNKSELNNKAVLYSQAQTLTHEQRAQAIANIGAQAANLFFKNVQVPANSFVADMTYDDYPFRAAIALSGVKDTMAPNVCFGVAQATDDNYAPVADSYNGGVYLYAKKTNDALFSIPFISLEVTE